MVTFTMPAASPMRPIPRTSEDSRAATAAGAAIPPYTTRLLSRSATILALTVSLALPRLALSAPVAVRFGALWDGSGRVLKNAVVVVDGDRIQSVGTEGPAEGTPVIDLSRFMGLPGLIDVHTHLTYGPAPGSTRAPAVNVVLGQEAARKTPEAGVPAVRGMNAPQGIVIALRRLYSSAPVAGPDPPRRGYDPGSRRRLEHGPRRNLETTRRAVKAGVRVAVGSDAIFTMFGENARELGWFVKARMTPEEAVGTAPTNAAALLGQEGIV